MNRSRLRYLILAAITIALGLLLQQVRSSLPFTLADVVGDALWGVMIYWLVGVLLPQSRTLGKAAIALAICWLVELSQLYHAPWIDSWRATTLGHLVLGSGFDLRDLVAYAIGVLVGVRLETTVLRKTA